MAGLVLKLRAHEEILINGVVMQNGSRNTRLIIKTPNVHVLRLRDAIRPGEVDTPAKRVCYLVQRVVAGETEADAAVGEIGRRIAELRAALRDAEASEHLDAAAELLGRDNFYGALRALRRVLAVESRLPGHTGTANTTLAREEAS
ncbi:MAG TPA: flagellar biosynthesis repressor FlbT [Thermohalobaculum sp.]|nr:flagellar biosynthesis repressor FlbT [Thermohalobaculum sp.]